MSGCIFSSTFPLFVSMFLLGDHVSYHPLSSIRLSWEVRHTCLSHLHLRLLICVAMDIASVLQSSSSLVMALGQNTLRIFCRNLFWKVSNLCASLAVNVKHSEPQRSILRTLLLYSLSFLFNLSCLDSESLTCLSDSSHGIFCRVSICCDFASQVCKDLNLFQGVTINYGNVVVCFVVVLISLVLLC